MTDITDDTNNTDDAGDMAVLEKRIDKFFDLNSIYDLQRQISIKSKYRSAYISMDSINREDVGDVYKMVWLYTTDGIARSGVVSTTGVVRDLVGMRIFPMRLPETNQSGFSYTYSILIEEFKSQSYVAHENRNFHFMFQPFVTEAKTGELTFTEYYPLNHGYFWFSKPFTVLESFTLTFADPLQLLPIPYLTLNLSNKFSYTYGNPTIITVLNPTYFDNGNLVRIVGFTTGDPVADAAIITAVNAEHTITVISSTSFSIPVNSTGATPITLLDSNSTLYNESKSIVISLELIFLDQN